MNASESYALLLIDIVDSAALAEQLGDLAMGQLWVAHDRCARDLLRRWRGREIDKTDGFLLLFVEARDALGFALDYHHALARLPVLGPLPEPLPLRVQARAGLHVGPVQVRENSPADVALGAKPLEVDGLAKPLAARVMSMALGGQTLLTSAALAALGVISQRLQSHGHWRLKGLAEPLELFEVGDEDAPFTPPADSAKAYRVVASHGAWQAAREIRHSLPAERDGFVGRHEQMLDLARRFTDAARLISVLGIGGSGKTRLVLHFGRIWLGDYPGGVWFCDLASARGLDGLLHAVALGLEVPLVKADPLEQLGLAIAGRGRCLVILDNFEQVARHAEETLGRWLDRASEAHFLVTTREVLGIAGEATLALPPLPGAEAQLLFLQRAAATRQGFDPNEDERAAIAELLRLLDGLPLAIELAAARVRILPPRALLARMSERFKLLASNGGRRDRQSTLRAAFDWSWDLLLPAERAALAQLSVFENGFTLAAAEAVIDLSAFDEAPWCVDAVHSLVDKSFVRMLEGERFDLLVSVQAYADEHLRTEGRFKGSGPPALRSAQLRHGDWFAALGPAHAADGDCADLENLVIACRRAVDRVDMNVALGTLEGAWEALSLHGPFKAGLELANQVAAMPSQDEAAQARVQNVLGRAREALGQASAARQHFECALQLARGAGAQRALAEAGICLARKLAREGQDQAARSLLGDALRLSQEIGDRALECSALNSWGNLEANMAHIAEAQGHYQSALNVAETLPQQVWRGSVMGNLGGLNMSLGHLDLAAEQLTEALRLARVLGDRMREGNTLSNLGLLHHGRGRFDEAVAVSEAAGVIARELGHLRLECTVLCNLGIFHLAQAQMAQARPRLEAALALARRLPDQRLEGQVLTYLADFHGREHNYAEARQCAHEGEVLLAALGDQLSLGELLCIAAQIEWQAAAPAAAQACLARAEELSDVRAASPQSTLGLALARVRALLQE